MAKYVIRVDFKDGDWGYYVSDGGSEVEVASNPYDDRVEKYSLTSAAWKQGQLKGAYPEIIRDTTEVEI